jgi:hypothetical protein
LNGSPTRAAGISGSELRGQDASYGRDGGESDRAGAAFAVPGGEGVGRMEGSRNLMSGAGPDGISIDEIMDFLATDDVESRHSRAARLLELECLFPIPETGIAIAGGLATGLAFNEGRLDYVHGFWLSTILASLAAIERHMAASLYAQGLDSAKRMSARDLVNRAEVDRMITSSEKSSFVELIDLRNSYAHFREPMIWIERLAKASENDVDVNEMLQEDARLALRLSSNYFQRNCTF